MLFKVYSMQKDKPPLYTPPEPTPQQRSLVITETPPTTPSTPSLGPSPALLTCPYCYNRIVTDLEPEPSRDTDACSLLLCAFGCWPCCWIPYCVNACQDQTHRCPNCKAVLGKFEN